MGVAEPTLRLPDGRTYQQPSPISASARPQTSAETALPITSWLGIYVTIKDEPVRRAPLRGDKVDRDLREHIASWDGAKGALLDEVLGSRNSIADSDQGKSFQAFYDFLLSHEKQTELSDLLDRVQRLEAVGDVDPRMRHIHYDWMDACR
jgi:Protein of unknown function (DUF3375)